MFTRWLVGAPRFAVAAGLALALIGCRSEPPVTVPPPAPPVEPPVVTNEELLRAFSDLGLETREVVEGVVVYLPSVYLFGFDSDELSIAALDTLQQVADVLNQERALSRDISVDGHTDSVGDEAYNMGLSERRAGRVRDELASGQVALERLTVRAYGESSPRAPNSTPDGGDDPDGRALNRRVELLVLNPGATTP